MSKWSQLSEFILSIEEDDCLTRCCEHVSKFVYAPHIGYRTWICRYKDIWVALYDTGNGHYDYCSRVSYIQFIIAKIMNFIHTFRKGD